MKNRIPLENIEIDTIQIGNYCNKECTHCSHDENIKKLELITQENFTRDLRKVMQLSQEIGEDLFSNYLLTSIDFDPFLHPKLAELTNILHDTTGKKFYILTSGWWNKSEYQQNANWIANNSEYIEKVSLTISNFPQNPSSIYKNARIIQRAIETFGKMPKGKFVISPQYNAEVEDFHIHSKKQVGDLLEETLMKAGYSKNDFEDRIFYRPVIGLGKAKSQLGVTKVQNYRIEAEQPSQIISIREKEKPYSGMIDLDGNLLAIKAPRGILNRPLKDYEFVMSLRDI